jgi:hypothetical protein
LLNDDYLSTLKYLNWYSSLLMNEKSHSQVLFASSMNAIAMKRMTDTMLVALVDETDDESDDTESIMAQVVERSISLMLISIALMISMILVEDMVKPYAC